AGLTYYLFLYIPSREQYFTESTFRQLAVLSEQLESLIAGLDSAMQNAAATEEYWDTIALVPNLDYSVRPPVCPTPLNTGTRICVSWEGPGLTDSSVARLPSDSSLNESPTLQRSARLYFHFGNAQTPTPSPTATATSMQSPTPGGTATPSPTVTPSMTASATM